MVNMKRKISDLKVAELKVELEKRGLESKGLKGVLLQRLQKAIEEEGGNSSEIETSGTDISSPKTTARRSASRAKRTTESESEASQEEEKENNSKSQADEPHQNERGDQAKREETVLEFGDNHNETDDSSNVVMETAPERLEDDGTPTRDEEGDVGTPPAYDEENIQEEDVTEEMVISEELPMMEEPGNDYRVEEGEEYQVEEEEEEIQDDHGGDDSATMVTVEEDEGGEMAENGESAADAVAEEEIEGGTIGDEVTEQQVVVNILEKTELVESEKSSDEKRKSESNGKEEVVVATEVDVLDMLDYDLEITGDQNNISNPSEDHSGRSKNSKKEATEKTADSTLTPSEDRKSRQGSDSLTPPSSNGSGPQSTAKSASSAAGKDGGKSVSSGKRDSGGSSGASKKDENPNKNLWISGLSSATRASELKSAFSRYGKVIGAKVVTNVKSPGSRCYGYVTMATAEAASKCILHLNNTEMHGRMITVEIAKGDPSASSKKQTSGSSGSTKKDTDAKENSSTKGKDSESKLSSASSRRPSSTIQTTNKDTDPDDKDRNENEKSQQDIKGREGGPFTRRSVDDGRKTGGSKSPSRDRSRAERTSTSGPRSGEKRHSNRSPAHGRAPLGRPGFKNDEPERKRPRPPDAADRKVVMDSNKGELRVNVSRMAGHPNDARTPRWQAEPKPRPLLSRRRSVSPARRRSLSPFRGSVISRPGMGRGVRGGRGGRGGFITRQSATYEDRNQARGGGRPHRGGDILSFNEIRAQQRDRERTRGSDRGRGGISRGGLHVDRERLRREREERDRLRIERERLERERRQLEKDRQERERLEAERLRLEQERKRELERIEREKAEMRRLQEITRYQVEQRQRAIKRTYDDDLGGHRGNRATNRDGYDPKRSLVSERDGRSDARRGEREDRRGYGGYGSRGGHTRNGPPAEPSPPGTSDYRSRQGYRGSGGANLDSRGKPSVSSYHDNRRGPPDSRHEPDTRYSTGSAGGRTIDKYDRRGGEGTGRSVEYSHGYGREASDPQPARRHGGPQPTRDTSARDGRKVIRERPTEHRSGGSPDFRRPAGRTGTVGRVEITREQSPPVRRTRRDASPPSTTGRRGGSSSRGGSWRETGKGGRDSSRRGIDERDLREQLRGRQESYSESSRERGSQRRAEASHSPSPPSRSSGQYQNRWPEGGSDSTSSQQIYSVGNDASAIPTQTGRSSGSGSWSHLQQWSQSAAQGARAWPATALPAAAATTVNRQIITTPHYASPTALIAPPGTTMIPATQGYIPSSDRQSRSFQASSYKQPIQRRY